MWGLSVRYFLYTIHDDKRCVSVTSPVFSHVPEWSFRLVQLWLTLEDNTLFLTLSLSFHRKSEWHWWWEDLAWTCARWQGPQQPVRTWGPGKTRTCGTGEWRRQRATRSAGRRAGSVRRQQRAVEVANAKRGRAQQFRLFKFRPELPVVSPWIFPGRWTGRALQQLWRASAEPVQPRAAGLQSVS